MSNYFDEEIYWIVGTGLTNTGPATLSINDAAPVNIERLNSGTLMPLGGGEMPAGKMVKGYYDGTEVVLDTDYTGGKNVGSTEIINYTTADPGYALETGQCLSQTGEPALYSKLGTQFNSADGCTSGQFGIPNKSGRVLAGADAMSGTAANILNNCASSIGATCGVQSEVVQQANLASFALPASSTANSTASTTITVAGSIFVGTFEQPFQTASSNNSPAGPGQLSNGDFSAVTTVNTTVSTSVSSGGSSTPLSNVQPTSIVYYEIKL